MDADQPKWLGGNHTTAGRLIARLRSSPSSQRGLWLFLALTCWALAGRVAYNACFRTQTDPTWERVRQAGVVRVCTDAAYPPFEFLDASGQMLGYDIDLVEEMARTWGLRAEFVNIHFDGLYDALLAGKCELVVSALPYDETLTEDVLYSPSYFNAGLLLAVHQDERRIRGVNQLDHKRVGVELGSAGHLEARRLFQEGRIPLQIVPFTTAKEALEALRTRHVEAVIADSISIYRFAHNPGGIRYLRKYLTDEQYVIAMRPDSGYIWKRIADGLARMKRDGFLEDLQARWF